MTWTVFFLGTLAGTRIATATTKAILHKNLPDVKGALCGSLYRFPPQPPKFGVVACGTAGEEVIVAASALEKGLKVLLLIPPLAEASCASHLGHQVHRAEIVTELGHRYPTVDVERRLRQVVEWGRYAGVLFYDERTDLISLHTPPSDRADFPIQN